MNNSVNYKWAVQRLVEHFQREATLAQHEWVEILRAAELAND